MEQIGVVKDLDFMLIRDPSPLVQDDIKVLYQQSRTIPIIYIWR